MSVPAENQIWDAIIVGAGAAGMAAGIFAARALPGRRILALDGAARLGAKILVSGGGRCNVTNAVITPADFNGGSRHVIQRVLAALPVGATIAFFREVGVELRREPTGKLFPTTDQARTVLKALLDELNRLGAVVRVGQKVTRIERHSDGFLVEPTAVPGQPTLGSLTSRSVVIATGGLSLPKTGSDGSGYEIVERLGHTLVPRTPALAPLVLEGGFHGPLSGISHEAALTLRSAGSKPVRIVGSLLWTHFGLSGPLALDMSRHWLRARLEGRATTLALRFLPGMSRESLDRRLQEQSVAQPRAIVRSVLTADGLPVRIVEAVLVHAGVSPETPLAHLSRAHRMAAAAAFTEFLVPVRDSRGYTFAEVTAGGVPLDEIDPSTMQSRRCPGLFLAGDILDVDGRIGGFNFQWAWSSAQVAAGGLQRWLTDLPETSPRDDRR